MKPTWSASGLCRGLCLCLSVSAAAGANPAPPAPAPELEPPALLHLLQRAAQLQASARGHEGDWQAAALYCQAARAGSTQAQYHLAMLYAFGRGVPQSRALAAALFSQAAAQGHAQAGHMLDTLQLSANQLPACVTQDQPPEPAPALAQENGVAAAAPTPAAIDRLLQGLPAHKRWIIPLTSTLATWYALDPRLVLSVIAVESNFETGAESSKAAMGLMQLIPETAARFNVRNAYDASQNLRGGMAYLRWLLSYYRGNTALALAAYNAGEGRVDRHQGVPPIPETRAYVRRVMGLYGQPRHAFDETLARAPTWLESGPR